MITKPGEEHTAWARLGDKDNLSYKATLSRLKSDCFTQGTECSTERQRK